MDSRLRYVIVLRNCLFSKWDVQIEFDLCTYELWNKWLVETMNKRLSLNEVQNHFGKSTFSYDSSETKIRMNHMPSDVLAELRALPGNNVGSKELF